MPPANPASDTSHIEHRALARRRARFAQDRQAIADRFDSGVRAAAHAVGAEEDDRKPQYAYRADTGMDLVDCVAGDRRQFGTPDQEGIDDQPGMHHHEGEEDRQQAKAPTPSLPRRFIPTISTTTTRQSQNFSHSQFVGRKLKIASAPLAIEIAIVRT